MYIQAENNLSILSIEINGIYSGLEKINISNCLDLVTSSSPKVLILTEDRVIASTQYIGSVSLGVALNIVGYNSTFGQ